MCVNIGVGVGWCMRKREDDLEPSLHYTRTAVSPRDCMATLRLRRECPDNLRQRPSAQSAVYALAMATQEQDKRSNGRCGERHFGGGVRHRPGKCENVLCHQP